MKIFIDLKFSGNTGDRIVKNCMKKLYKCFKKEATVKFVLHYQTTKLSYFTNTNDKTPLLSQSSVVYKSGPIFIYTYLLHDLLAFT